MAENIKDRVADPRKQIWYQQLRDMHGFCRDTITERMEDCPTKKALLDLLDFLDEAANHAYVWQKNGVLEGVVDLMKSVTSPFEKATSDLAEYAAMLNPSGYEERIKAYLDEVARQEEEQQNRLLRDLGALGATVIPIPRDEKPTAEETFDDAEGKPNAQGPKGLV